MGKPEIIEILKQEKPTLALAFGVQELALFGSYARNEEHNDSDIDILVKLDKPDFRSLIGVMRYLENKLNKKIDIVRKGPHLSKRFYQLIAKDIIYV